ncbi:MAG: four helix bundle protein [Bacteroidota bacterium]
MDQGLGKRLFDFSVNVIKYSRKLPNSKEYDIIKNQLIKSSISSGANYSPRQIKKIIISSFNIRMGKALLK